MGARELRLLAVILLQDCSDSTQQLLVRQVRVLLWKDTCDCQSTPRTPARNDLLSEVMNAYEGLEKLLVGRK